MLSSDNPLSSSLTVIVISPFSSSTINTGGSFSTISNLNSVSNIPVLLLGTSSISSLYFTITLNVIF